MGKRDDEIKAFLGKETEFGGKLILSGSVRIDGIFKGEVWGSGTLIVGKDASVEATISVDRIQISGNVRGKLEIKEKTEITETGSFTGSMKTPLLVIGEGGIFDGQCAMGKGEKQEQQMENSE
ncbi:MAG: polymer-forming cytoskeletal protein [Syntrophales bacterium]|nr:polymer-forming cytoskeletal protein [Syntrophales bacterium]